jgi:F-type H+-transporting ATPase subunit delta
MALLQEKAPKNGNMLDKSLAKRYARAVYSKARIDKNGNDTLHQLRQINAAIDDNPALKAFFAHPAIPRGDKITLAGEMFKNQVSLAVHKFISLLITSKRIDHLPAIADEYQILVNEDEKRAVVKIVSAFPISDNAAAAARQRMMDILHSDVSMSIEVDSALIGGARIFIGDRMLDGTIDSRLQRLEKSLKS